MTDGRIRVAIADDHALFRKGLRALLDSVPDIDLVAEAENGDQAVRVAVSDRPHVLLLDIRMPGHDGLSAMRRIRVSAPEVAVVMLTMVDESRSLSDALRGGAVGYVLKDADPQELLGTIRAAARGDLLLGASIAGMARSLWEAPAGPWRPPLPELSDRERSVLDLLAAGGSVPEIATALYLSEKSVRNYLTTIPRRLGVADRDEAIELARAAGLGRGPAGSSD
jgi:DNA-binding NarL/FixJ family response regulator